MCRPVQVGREPVVADAEAEAPGVVDFPADLPPVVRGTMPGRFETAAA